MGALGLSSEADLKWAFAGFGLAYALFEIPSGWLGDRVGARAVLVRIVLWWSIFTALTALAGVPLGRWTVGLGALILIRFLFGAGEAGAYPNITRALHDWFPVGERGFAQGMVWMAGRLSGGLTPLIWTLFVAGVRLDSGKAWLPPLLSWRATFCLFAVAGVVWALLFALWFRNHPAQKSGVSRAELALINEGRAAAEAGPPKVPWLALLLDGNLWALCLMYFCGAYGWYFNITYLPRYLETQHGVASTSVLGAIAKGSPLWAGAIACLAGGWLTDRLTRRWGRKWGRRMLGLVGHGACALCYFSCLLAPGALSFCVAVALAAFCNDLTMAPAWAVCQDIGRRYTATVAGCMNTQSRRRCGELGDRDDSWLCALALRRFTWWRGAAQCCRRGERAVAGLSAELRDLRSDLPGGGAVMVPHRRHAAGRLGRCTGELNARRRIDDRRPFRPDHLPQFTERETAAADYAVHQPGTHRLGALHFLDAHLLAVHSFHLVAGTDLIVLANVCHDCLLPAC